MKRQRFRYGAGILSLLFFFAAGAAEERLLCDATGDSPLVRLWMMGLARQGEAVRVMSRADTPEDEAALRQAPRVTWLTAAEVAALNPDWQLEPIAYAALGLYVNAANSLGEVTLEQARAMFSGALPNWRSLNHEPYEFHRFGLKDQARGMPRLAAMLIGDALFAAAIFKVESSPEVRLLVANTPHSVGYALWTDRPGPGVKMLAVDGVAPEAATVRDGRWPWRWTVALVYRTADPAADFWREQARRLAAELTAPTAKALLRDEGWIALEEPKEAEEK